MPILSSTPRLLLSASLASLALTACGDGSSSNDTSASDTDPSETSTGSTSVEATGTDDPSASDGSSSTGAETPAEPVVRVSASAMSTDEVDRFQRAFTYAVDQGWMDAFCDSHGDHGQRHHGAELMPDSPLFIRVMSTTHGHRLFPWHRSFVLEAEMMLQAALRERNLAEGLDPSEGDLVFIPYWDAAHDQAVPDWLNDYLPPGGTAIAPENLPEGHAGHGHEGERYDIQIGRWPGNHPGFPNLAPPEQIGRVLDGEDFADFYSAIDYRVEFEEPDPPTQAALDALVMAFPDNEDIWTVVMAVGEDVLSNEEAIEVINAVSRLGYDVATSAANGEPNPALEDALGVLTDVVRPPPHALMHLWAGGLDPDDPEVRGTLTYFNELCVDPLFWMLHTELDRYWYTWSQTHSGDPPLEGDDALFQPIPEDIGAVYGGGRMYTLDQMTDVDGLPFRYDAPFVP